jgi:hypothetical protein
MRDAGPDFAFAVPKQDARGDRLSTRQDNAAAKCVTCPALEAATSAFLSAVSDGDNMVEEWAGAGDQWWAAHAAA